MVGSSLVTATVWVNGERRPWTPYESPPGDGVRWFDINNAAKPEAVFEQLEPHCLGLELEMVADLLSPDTNPESFHWNGGEIRLASTFGVYPPPGPDGTSWSRRVERSPQAVYQAVEILAGRSWLISRWHDAWLYRGAKREGGAMPPVGRSELLEEVSKRWSETGGTDAGDLGVLAMHELALTYSPAQRHFQSVLEAWELDLYKTGSDADDALTSSLEPRLHELWNARARLCDWLSPLNVAGLNRDLDKAWLPVSEHREVKAVDERIDRALDELARLGDILRDSFHLLHIKKSEAQREHQDRLQRRVEIVATALLVPTLIVGFFGANTWVPGEHRHSGLTLMLIAMAVLTTIALAVLWASHRRHRARAPAWTRARPHS